MSSVDPSPVYVEHPLERAWRRKKDDQYNAERSRISIIEKRHNHKRYA